VLHGGAESLCDRGGHVIRPGRLYAPFDIGLGKLGCLFREKIGPERENAARLLSRRDHDRALVARSGEEVAERMAEAGRRMQVDGSRTSGRLGITICHADDAGFLQPEHVIDIGRPIM
jgi:hypothetical protein